MFKSDVSKWKAVMLRIGATVFAIGIWFWFAEIYNAESPILSNMGPVDTFIGIQDLIERNVLVDSILFSLTRLIAGLLLAALLGVTIGLVFGLRKEIEYAFGIVVQFLRMTSPLAWAPVAVMVFGIGTAPVVFLITLAAIWPIALATSSGVRAVDANWIKVAKSLGASSSEITLKVVAPAITQHVLTGLRLAIGIAWVVLVPAEMLGVDSGLGFLILNARDQLSYQNLAATMFVIGAVGFALDWLTQKLFKSFNNA